MVEQTLTLRQRRGGIGTGRKRLPRGTFDRLGRCRLDVFGGRRRHERIDRDGGRAWQRKRRILYKLRPRVLRVELPARARRAVVVKNALRVAKLVPHGVGIQGRAALRRGRTGRRFFSSRASAGEPIGEHTVGLSAMAVPCRNVLISRNSPLF